MATKTVNCEMCEDRFIVQGNTFEEIQDSVLLHILLKHEKTEWELVGLPKDENEWVDR